MMRETHDFGFGGSLFFSRFMVNKDAQLALLTKLTTILVLNFAILARQYFARFYFRDFNRQI